MTGEERKRDVRDMSADCAWKTSVAVYSKQGGVRTHLDYACCGDKRDVACHEMRKLHRECSRDGAPLESASALGVCAVYGSSYHGDACEIGCRPADVLQQKRKLRGVQ